VKYTALAIFFVLVCVTIGMRVESRATQPWLPASLAAAMVAAQFVLLTWL